MKKILIYLILMGTTALTITNITADNPMNNIVVAKTINNLNMLQSIHAHDFLEQNGLGNINECIQMGKQGKIDNDIFKTCQNNAERLSF